MLCKWQASSVSRRTARGPCRVVRIGCDSPRRYLGALGVALQHINLKISMHLMTDVVGCVVGSDLAAFVAAFGEIFCRCSWGGVLRLDNVPSRQLADCGCFEMSVAVQVNDY